IFKVIKFGAEKNARILAQDPKAQKYVFELLGEGPYEDMVVYVPGAENKALRLVDIQLKYVGYGYIESVEREIGQILGYSEENTDRYIENLKKEYPDLPKFPPPDVYI